MKFEVRSRYDGKMLFELECRSLRFCLEAAVKSRADLSRANLSWADLSWANLSGADLSWANLKESCLDPTAIPNADVAAFGERDGDWVIGYRTRKTSAAGLQLQDDRIYCTEVFSVSDTECHPGWYLWPTLDASKDFSPEETYIKVKARVKDIHKAGSKWRSRAIWVIGEAK